jgi:hypothetical protein
MTGCATGSPELVTVAPQQRCGTGSVVVPGLTLVLLDDPGQLDA